MLSSGLGLQGVVGRQSLSYGDVQHSIEIIEGWVFLLLLLQLRNVRGGGGTVKIGGD